MKEFEEDNLENFFRNRAEGDQYEFREEDWHRLEARLNARDLAAGLNVSKYFWMAVGAALTAVLFLAYILFNEPAEISVIGQESQVAEVTSPIIRAQHEGDVIAENKTTEELNTVSDSQPQSMATLQENSIPRQRLLDNDDNQNIDAHGNTLDDGQSKNSPDGLVVTNILSDQENEERNTTSTVKVFDNDVPVNFNITSAEAIRAPYQYAKMPLDYPDLHKKDLPDELELRRFYTLSLTGAMDISSTSESAWGKRVLRIGIGGEYFIYNRLSIGLGVNISEKKYSAMGREYAPPKGFWTNGVVPDSTNAACQVLDVPVTLSYFHPAGRRGSIVFHAGMSSWFMLKEKYYYKYVSGDPDLVKNWHGQNENNYWFGILNLSVSYEYMLNNKWSVAIGPYYNLPLTGLGHGNVELTSFGLRSSVRFNKYQLARIR